jgi:sphingolipid delta-4 desaturase
MFMGKTYVREFTWQETDEPHATRRREIIEKYPQIRSLFVKEPLTAVVVMFIFVTQMTIAYYIRDASWAVYLLVAYAYGGTVNHTLQLAVHDLSHNLAFDSVAANRICSMFANLVTGFPSGMTFIRYHMDHHRFQGVDGWDTDVPTKFEVNTFTNALLKTLWVILQPAFYGIRPMLVKPQTPNLWELANQVVQISFDLAILYFWGLNSLAYFLIGTLLGLGLHPCAGHFIAEHYEFTKGSETYSYYGPLNFFNLNVGYHYEHHDFPKVPWTKLPEVSKIAPEYYDTLPHYDSYLKVFWKYIMDPTVGPHSRIKRKTTKALESLKANGSDHKIA